MRPVPQDQQDHTAAPEPVVGAADLIPDPLDPVQDPEDPIPGDPEAAEVLVAEGVSGKSTCEPLESLQEL